MHADDGSTVQNYDCNSCNSHPCVCASGNVACFGTPCVHNQDKEEEKPKVYYDSVPLV